MLSAEVRQALQKARLLYVTTYSPTGKSGTVPVLFLLHHEAIYFSTKRDSLKVRRLRHHGRATIHIGQRSGPRLECVAQLIDDDLSLQRMLLRTYRRRYPWRGLILVPLLRRAFARGMEVLVRLTPQTPEAVA